MTSGVLSDVQRVFEEGTLTGPSDIVLARRLMYLVHRVMVRQANGADPGPSLLGVEHQSRQ
jgi:hypothetical protein